MVRTALRLRDGSLQQPLRDPNSFNSALRSDYTFVPGPLGEEETFLNSEADGYDGALLSFDPQEVFANNPFAAYGAPLAFKIVRSPAGFPVTPLDGVGVVQYDYQRVLAIDGQDVAANVAFISTVEEPPGVYVGQTVVVDTTPSFYNGTFVATAVGPYTFSYALVHANASSLNTGTVTFDVDPIEEGKLAVAHDSGLLSGRFYYYGLFARYFFEGNVYWLRVAHSDVLVPVHYGYADRLLAAIPQYYRQLDDEHIGSYAGQGLLRRFTQAWGYEADVQRTWALTIGDLWDVDRLSSRLLPELGENILGLEVEAGVGDKRYRALLANIIFLRKFSGTLTGIEGYMAALTGYKVVAFDGKNLYQSKDDTIMLVGTGRWVAPTASTVLSRQAGDAGQTGGPALITDHYLKVLNSTGGSSAVELRYGATSMATNLSGTTSITIPVVPGHQYAISIMVKAPVVGSVTPAVTFGTLSGADVHSGPDIATAAVWTRVQSVWYTAPADAVNMRMSWVSSAIADAAAMLFWKPMVMDRSWRPTGVPVLVGSSEPDPTYEEIGTLHINLYPQRTNFAVNADFNVNPGTFPEQGWTATEPSTYELLPQAYATYADLAPKTVTNKALTSNVATITTATAHKLIVGPTGGVVVSGVGAPFNGTFEVTSTPTTTTFTYACTNADIASVASGGTVVGPEINYTDLAAGLDPLASTAGISIVTSIHEMRISNSDTNTAHVGGVFFPAVAGTAYSARLLAMSRSGGAPPDPSIIPTVAMRFRWYTDNIISSEIPGSSTVTDFFTLSLSEFKTLTLTNAIAPAGAVYGRFYIEVTSPVPGSIAGFRKILVEDSAIPGTWFDGHVTDGAFGDFRFTGAEDESFSVYYANFNATLNALSSSGRAVSVLTEIVPPGVTTQIHSVLNGLLS